MGEVRGKELRGAGEGSERKKMRRERGWETRKGEEGAWLLPVTIFIYK